MALSEVVAVLESGSRPAGGVSEASGEIPSVGAEHLADDGGFNFSKVKRIPRAYFGSMRAGIIKPHDILIVKDGATTGKVSFVNGQFPFQDAAANEHVFVLRVDKKRAYPDYVFRYLYSNQGQLQILKDFRGATVGGISRNFVNRVMLPLPSTSEQRRIAAILDKADAIRRKRRQALAETDTLLRSIFLAIVGHQHPDYHKWPMVSFENLATPGKNAVRTGPFGSDLLHSEFVDDGVAVLGIDNAVNNRFTWDGRRFITVDKYQELKRYKVFPGDVIVTIMGTTGRSAVVPDDIPEAITTKHLATITPNRSNVHPTYLSFAIHADPLVVRQIKRANKGAIMAGLNLGIIKQLEVHLPPFSQQELFTHSVERVHRQQKILTDPAINGEALFQSLSQRAFRGEL